MSTHQKERRLHPQWASPMRKQNFQSGKVDSNVVHVDGIAILVPRSRKDRGPGMDHHRNAILLGNAVDGFKLLHTVQIIIRVQQLVWWMYFDHANAKAHDLLHVSLNVGGMARMHTATGNQPFRLLLHILSDEVVHRRREANHLGRHVVDEHRTINANLVQVPKKLLRRAAELDHFVEVGPLLFHGRQRRRVEHLDWLDVHVAVGDHRSSAYRECGGSHQRTLWWMSPGVSKAGNSSRAGTRSGDLMRIKGGLPRLHACY